MNPAMVVQSVRGAVRVGLGARAGFADLDLTAEGFFRSFLAFFVCLPLHLLIHVAQRAIAAETGAAGLETATAAPGFVPLGIGGLGIQAAVFALGFLIFPLAMIAVARFLGLARNYAAYVIAYNWGTVAVLALLAPPFLLYGLGVLDAGAAISLGALMALATLAYRFSLARTALGAPWPAAAGIVALDLMLAGLLSLGFEALSVLP